MRQERSGLKFWPLAGHLTGWVPPAGERALLATFTALALVFAARKYTQAVKDDIGDKSVFMCAADFTPALPWPTRHMAG